MKNAFFAVLALVLVVVIGCDKGSSTEWKPRLVDDQVTTLIKPIFGTIIEGPVPLTKDLGVVRVKAYVEDKYSGEFGATVARSSGYRIGDKVEVKSFYVYNNSFMRYRPVRVATKVDEPASAPASKQ